MSTPVPRSFWHQVARRLAEPRRLGRSAGTFFTLALRGETMEIARRLALREAPATMPPPPPVHAARRYRRTGEGPVRLAMVGHAFRREGAPLSQLDIATGLARHGSVAPMLFAFEDGPLRDEARARGLVAELVPLPRLLAARDLDRAAERLAARLAEAGAETVVANTILSFPAIAAARRLGIPAILNPRESLDRHAASDGFPPAVAARAWEALADADRAVFAARATRDEWAKLLPPERSVVIPNTVAPGWPAALAVADRAAARQALGAQPDNVVALSVGTLAAHKGQLDLVEAFASVAADRPQLRLALLGGRDPAYGRKVDAALAGLPKPVRARVHLLPETDSPAPYYAAADLYVCASRSESHPRVILEAMAAGLPLVTTPVDGIAEQIGLGHRATPTPHPVPLPRERERCDDPSVNLAGSEPSTHREAGHPGSPLPAGERQGEGMALTFPPSDVAALAIHLGRLADDAALRTRLGAAAKARLAELPDHDAMIAAYARAVLGLFAD